MLSVCGGRRGHGAGSGEGSTNVGWRSVVGVRGRLAGIMVVDGLGWG